MIMVFGAIAVGGEGIELPSIKGLFGSEAQAASEKYDVYTYEVGSDGTVTITDCDNSAQGAITIPSQIDGKPVTSIGNYAFSSCYSLTSITIPDGVTSIGVSAFSWCSRLSSITIPDSVTSIGYKAFYRCDSLKAAYYLGFSEQWAEVSIGSENSCLTSCVILEPGSKISDVRLPHQKNASSPMLVTGFPSI